MDFSRKWSHRELEKLKFRRNPTGSGVGYSASAAIQLDHSAASESGTSLARGVYLAKGDVSLASAIRVGRNHADVYPATLFGHKEIASPLLTPAQANKLHRYPIRLSVTEQTLTSLKRRFRSLPAFHVEENTRISTVKTTGIAQVGKLEDLPAIGHTYLAAGNVLKSIARECMLHLLNKSASYTFHNSVLAISRSVFSRHLHKLVNVNTAMHLHRDPNTLSNYDKFRVTHTKADLSVDFDNKVLKGTVTHTVKSINGTAETAIILDTRLLDVHKVSVNGEQTRWELLAQSKPYGHALKVPLNRAIENEETLSLSIDVQTTQDGTAVQFLTPVQARSQYPYMFSQCQAINARSIFPCQDTPDVKSTFEFNITSPLPVLASGLAVGSPEAASASKNNEKVYRFRQDIPIPSYLFALASGDIVTAPIGPRSVVATGPEGIKAAQWEFEESTEAYIESIEKIIYPYQWGTYNLLVLPPSFPYGGMENPVYTYCTPTVVSGDRQNVDVIAHELSHSWSGNLVTASSWEHFWLNEGWTTYLERRLQAAVHGEPHRDFSAIIGWKSLSDAVNGYGSDHNFTRMIPDLEGKDPEDAFSTVPYEKGYTFLSYLEAKVGKEKWNKFIPHYFTTFKGASLDSYQFKSNLIDFFTNDSIASTALTTVNWEEWFYKPGLPPKPDFDTSLADVCFKLASVWKHADPLTFKPDKTDIMGWAANQVVVFLDRILEFPEPLSPELADTMGKAYELATSTNVEVTARYFQVGLRAKDKNVYPLTAKLLGNVGRMKFVRPLYRELNKVDRKLALDTFEKNKDFYHPICRGLVEQDLATAST